MTQAERDVREVYERSIERLVQLLITLNAGAITFSASLIRGDFWWLLRLAILLSWGFLLFSLISCILFLFERTNALQVNLAVLQRGRGSIKQVPEADRKFNEFTDQMAKHFQRCLSTFIGGIILLAAFAAGRIFGGWFFPLLFVVSSLGIIVFLHRRFSFRFEGWWL